MQDRDLLPDPSRPRPDADLASIQLGLDWKTITIASGDPDALGRIFSWLLTQVQEAKYARPDR